MEKKSISGRSYINGKALGDDLRSLIIDDLKDAGAKIGEKMPKGLVGRVAEKYKVCQTTIYRLWKKYSEDLSIKRRPYSTGRPKKYGVEELEFVHVLKKERPSMQLKTVKDQLLQYSNIEAISYASISRMIHNDLNMTYKRVTHYKKERFTLGNLQYTQQFLNYVHNKDPFLLKFMDEMGVNLTNAQPKYGHSEKGTPCVELTRYNRHSNFTVSLIVGVTGVKYVKVIEGSSDSVEFLQFIGEAIQSYTDDGEPVFTPGQCLVVDNAPTHHNLSERVLRRFLPTVGLEYLFLPAYSPDLNPAENCFRKVKALLQTDRYIPFVKNDLKVAVYKAFGEISLADTCSFFQATEYIDV